MCTLNPVPLMLYDNVDGGWLDLKQMEIVGYEILLEISHVAPAVIERTR